MSVRRCAACGSSILADLCQHHLTGHGDDWATANRIFCDLLHRGKQPPKVDSPWLLDALEVEPPLE